jgi:hypothetical protein
VPHEGGVLVSAPSLRYTVTMPPDDMDSTAIAIGERVRIEDKVALFVLHAASGSGPAESGGDNAQDTGTRSDAEVGFQFSTGAICPLCTRTLQMKTR